MLNLRIEKRNKETIVETLRRNAEILLTITERHRSSSENKSSEEKEDDETRCMQCLHKYLELWIPVREFAVVNAR